MVNDSLVDMVGRLPYWHQRRALRGLSRFGINLTLRVDGLRLSLEPDHDYVQWQLMSAKCWERPVTDVIKDASKHSRLVFDVGANVGYFSLVAALESPPEATVVAFEPFPRNFQTLGKNVRLNDFNDKIRCELLAISRGPGE